MVPLLRTRMVAPGESYRGQARTWCDPNGGTSHHHGHRLSTDTAYCKNGGRTTILIDVYPNHREICHCDVYVRGCTRSEVRVMNEG